MKKELRLRAAEHPQPLESVYLGGGTPSLLTQKELEELFEVISTHYTLVEGAEITLEANPDDLDDAYLAVLADSPVNRLSIGIQSFFEEDLRFFGRAHNAKEAHHCIQAAQTAGFDNITLDLIYGSPTTDDDRWRNNLEHIQTYGVPHLSAYALTVEPKTALAHQIRVGKTTPLDEARAARQFEQLQDWAQQHGYAAYEVSNLAKKGYHSRHNSAYWQQQAYLGIGPSAHSYDGRQQRSWNIANNALYIKQLAAVDTPEQWRATEGALYETEQLSAQDQYNEYVMTALRTSLGVNIDRVPAPFQSGFLAQAEAHLQNGHLIQEQSRYYLSRSGRFLADGIASSFFVVD